MRGNILVQHGRLHRLQQAFIGRLPKIAGIHRQQHIGGGVLALGLQALHQRALLVGDELHRHASLLGEGIEHRLDQLLRTRRVNHDLVGGMAG